MTKVFPIVNHNAKVTCIMPQSSNRARSRFPPRAPVNKDPSLWIIVQKIADEPCVNHFRYPPDFILPNPGRFGPGFPPALRATEYAIATACFWGFPACISRLMFSDIAALEPLLISGIAASLPKAWEMHFPSSGQNTQQRDQSQQEHDHPDPLLNLLWYRPDEALNNPDREIDDPR